ncbi:hypothetical protein H4R33_002192 [Dimargaris cristalligena]|nr:hypothetical protein H4R33_002192 [Dimargaris cristalligena]
MMPVGLNIKPKHMALAKSLSANVITHLCQYLIIIKLPAPYKGTVVHMGMNLTWPLGGQSTIDLTTMQNMSGGQALDGAKQGTP